MSEITKEYYTPANCNEWVECLKTNDGLHKNDDVCCTILCLPIKFPVNLIFCGPCALLNICCNKCKNTENKNHLF